jgi:DnaJ-class molecular chaperone
VDNHYATLNVAMDAPDAVVRAAWRVLTSHYHPDRRGAGSAARMQQVNAAYRVLSDPRERAEHDAALRRQRCRRAGDGSGPAPVADAPLRPRGDGAADAALAYRRAQVAQFYAQHARRV